MDKPNMLLITVDQLRWDVYVPPVLIPALELPNVMRLQREGATLPHAYTNCPICMPTRMTWLYGLYASQVSARLMANDDDWPRDRPSMAHALQAAGYHTALVGKLHSLCGLHPRNLIEEEPVTRSRGFDDVCEVSGKELALWYDCRWTAFLRERGALTRYREETRKRCWAFPGAEEHGDPSFLFAPETMDGFIGARAVQWLETCRTDRPFFLHASFCGPHPPLDPAPEYAERFRPEDMPAPTGVDDPSAIALARRRRAAYCALMAQLDDELGRLLEVLDCRGLRDNTVVVFANDHGDMLGEQGLWSKGRPQDGAIRTPYIVRWPGRVPAGHRSDAMVEAVDLPCFLLDAAGLGERLDACLPGTPGRSFLPTIAQADAAGGRNWIYSEFAGFGSSALASWRVCRERDWKYVFHPGGHDALFAMSGDGPEIDNLADDPAHRDTRDRLRRQLLESMAVVVAPGRTSNPKENP